MRFLHTADWHLGRNLHGFDLLDDQAYILEQIIAMAEDSAVDAVIIAGDVYDRALPPADAVELFDDALNRLAVDLAVPVLIIAGNHDSGPRLAFGARLLAAQGVHIAGPGTATPYTCALDDRHGPVRVTLLPYAEPAHVRHALDDDSLHDHDRATRARLARLSERGQRHVLVAHLFALGGGTSDSERPLSVGGAEQVAIDAFAGFSYTALGHLHRPQAFNAQRIAYAGSPLAYSLSEADQTKSVSLVELDKAGSVHIERLPLSPKRAVRRVRGRLDDILAMPASNDYLGITLNDAGALYDPLGKLRARFPHVVHIDRPAYTPQGPVAHRADLQGDSGLLALFEDFVQAQTGAFMDDDQRKVAEATQDAVLRAERAL